MKILKIILGFFVIFPICANAQTNPNFGYHTPLPSATLNTDIANKVDIGNVTASVPSLAALQALPAGQFPSVYRQGYSIAGDGGSATYEWFSSACSLNGGAGDGGLQVKPNAGAGCWIAQTESAAPSILLWGGDPTGANDVIPALTSACAGIPGRTIYFPSGNYLVNSSYNQTNVCNIFGDKPSEVNYNNSKTSGTWFYVNNTSISPFTFGIGSAGSKWEKFSILQAQPAPTSFTGTISGVTMSASSTSLSVGSYIGGANVPAGTYITVNQGGGTYTLSYAAPTSPSIGSEAMTAWQPTIYNNAIFNISNVLGGIYFNDIMLFGVYNGFNIINSGRFNGKDIIGQVFNKGLYFDNDQDTSFLDNIKFWPFWNSDASVISYSQYNSDAIVSGRQDTPMWGKLFALGMRSLLHLISTSSGITSGVTIDQLNSDDSLYTLLVDNNNTTMMVGKMYSAGGGIPNSEIVHINGSFNTIDLGQDNFGNVGCSAVNVASSVGGNILRSSTMTLTNINQNPGGNCATSAINIANASTPNSFTMPIQPSLLSYSGSVYPINNQISPSTTNAIVDVPITAPWTPTLQGATTGTISYSNRYGAYVLKGDQVTANFNITIAGNVSGFSGSIYISGLPYSPPSSAVGYGCNIYYYSGITLSSGNTFLSGTIGGGSQNIVLDSVGGSSPAVLLNSSQLGANTNISGSCTYLRN